MQTRRLCEYKGPGGLTATEIMAKVQESARKDAQYSEKPAVEQMSTKMLLLHLKALNVNTAGIFDRNELIQLAKRNQAKVPDPITDQSWRKKS